VFLKFHDWLKFADQSTKWLHAEVIDYHFNFVHRVNYQSRPAVHINMSVLESTADWLFGIEKNRNAGYYDKHMPVLHEGQLDVHTGFSWQSSYWRVVWRDDMKSQAMMLRFKSVNDYQPMAGKMSCIPLGTIRTLVPIEEHEIQANILPTMVSSSSSSSKPKPRRSSMMSGRSRFRIALETVDGSTLMLATNSPQERLDWLHILYATLVSTVFIRHTYEKCPPLFSLYIL
jgi:hypothetical protein